MGNQKKKARNQRIVVLVGCIVVLVVLIVLLAGSRNKLKNVEIVREGDGSTQAVLSDQDIIRAAGIKMNSSINAVEDKEETIRAGIDELGLVTLTGVERANKDSIVIRVKERTPCLALVSGSGYLVTDREGYVIGRFDDVENMKVLKVNGITVNNPMNGSLAETAPASLIRNALEVGCAVIDNDFCPLVSSLSYYSDTYRLIMDTGLIVRFYIGDDLNELFGIIKGFFDEGVTTGEVIISGGQAALNPRVVDYEADD